VPPGPRRLGFCRIYAHLLSERLRHAGLSRPCERAHRHPRRSHPRVTNLVLPDPALVSSTPRTRSPCTLYGFASCAAVPRPSTSWHASLLSETTHCRLSVDEEHPMSMIAPACEFVHASEARVPLLLPFSKVWGNTTARPNAPAAPSSPLRAAPSVATNLDSCCSPRRRCRPRSHQCAE
jgi:hypothetical protein